MKKISFLVCLLFSVCGFSAPLPAKNIFQIEVKSVDANTFYIQWHIKPGYFLYQKRIKLTPHAESNFTVGSFQFPESVKKMTAQGVTEPVYRDNLTLAISILGTEPGEGLLDVHYQGCSDDGFCYPPQMNQVKLAIDKHLALNQVDLENEPLKDSQEKIQNNDKFSLLFSNHHWPIILIIFFGFGLLLAFTPCVLPMVPVLSGIIVGHGKNISTRKAFLLSLTYVLSMSFTYAIVGAVVALMGSNLQIMMQSPIVIGLFSLIFILLALSMFNLYELRMPASWQAKFANLTKVQAHGHYLGTALMGCFSSLILSPCVTAPLIGALAYIAQTGSVLLGSMALFFLSLGMGTPLILVGMSAGKLLPRAGQWMNAIKFIFGIMLLATAIYLLQRILPSAITMAFWGSLLIFSGIYSGALQKADCRQTKCGQSVGLILLCYGLLILIGASLGNSNPLQPLVASEHISYETHTNTRKETTLIGVKQALQHANRKPVILDFYADWCASCQHIEATTLQDPQVKAALNEFIMVKVDLTQNDKETQNLLQYFNVVAPPTFLFFNQYGQEQQALRLVGNINTETFISHLEQLNIVKNAVLH